MKMYNLDRLFLMKFMKFIYSTIQFPTMEHPYQWVVTNLGGNKSFQYYSPFMNIHEL